MQKTLCVDLDGTVIKNDVTKLSIKRYIGDKKSNIFQLIKWYILYGKAFMKKMVALNIKISPHSLKYNIKFLNFLKEEQKKGVKIYLATASDTIYAISIANFLNIFDGVIASDGVINIKDKNKANVLAKYFGDKNFDYAGNSTADLAVWKKSAKAILVNPSFFARIGMFNKTYKLFKD